MSEVGDDFGRAEFGFFFPTRESWVMRIKEEGVADFVVCDGIKIVRFVSEISGMIPVVIGRREKPAEGVVIAGGFRFEAARAAQTVVLIQAADEGSFTAGAEFGVVDSIGVEKVAVESVVIPHDLPGMKAVGIPNPGFFGAGWNRFEVQVVDEECPVVSGLLRDASRVGIFEEAGFIFGKIERDGKMF